MSMILAEWKIQNRWKQVIQDKLSGYKYIDNLYQLQKGRYIRWLNKNSCSTPGIN